MSLVSLKTIGNADEAQSSLQLSVVCIALLIELLELGDVLGCLCELLGVLFHPLADGGGKPEGCCLDSSAERWVEHEDCFCGRGRDRGILSLHRKVGFMGFWGDLSGNGEWEGD